MKIRTHPGLSEDRARRAARGVNALVTSSACAKLSPHASAMEPPNEKRAEHMTKTPTDVATIRLLTGV